MTTCWQCTHCSGNPVPDIATRCPQCMQRTKWTAPIIPSPPMIAMYAVTKARPRRTTPPAISSMTTALTSLLTHRPRSTDTYIGYIVLRYHVNRSASSRPRKAHGSVGLRHRGNTASSVADASKELKRESAATLRPSDNSAVRILARREYRAYSKPELRDHLGIICPTHGQGIEPRGLRGRQRHPQLVGLARPGPRRFRGRRWITAPREVP